MKKLIALCLILATLLSLGGCGGGSVEVDLIANEIIGPQAVYSLAVQVCQDPSKYVGKTVQAEGALVLSVESATGVYIEVADNTCCFQNIAFKMKKETELPPEGNLIRIKGTFTEEIKELYCKKCTVFYEESRITDNVCPLCHGKNVVVAGENGAPAPEKVLVIEADSLEDREFLFEVE